MEQAIFLQNVNVYTETRTLNFSFIMHIESRLAFPDNAFTISPKTQDYDEISIREGWIVFVHVRSKSGRNYQRLGRLSIHFQIVKV